MKIVEKVLLICNAKFAAIGRNRPKPFHLFLCMTAVVNQGRTKVCEG